MDNLHYERCERCNVQCWEQEIHQHMVEIWLPKRHLIYLCKTCLAEIYLKDKEDNNETR
jgi:hypothetical protein